MKICTGILTLLLALSSWVNPETHPLHTTGQISLEGHYYRPFILKKIEDNSDQFSYESLSDSEGYMELVLKADKAKGQDGYLVHYDGLKVHQRYAFQLTRKDEKHFTLHFSAGAPFENAALYVSKNDTSEQTFIVTLGGSDYTFSRRVFKPDAQSGWQGFPDLEHYLKYLHYAGSYKLIVNGGKNRKIQLDYKGNVTGAEDLLDCYILRQNTEGYDIVFFGKKADFPNHPLGSMGTAEMLTHRPNGWEYGDYYADKWIFRLVPL